MTGYRRHPQFIRPRSRHGIAKYCGTFTAILFTATCLLLPVNGQGGEVISSEQLIKRLDTRKMNPPRINRGMVKTKGDRQHASDAGAATGSVVLNIQFEHNSSELSRSSIVQLNELGKALTASALAGDRFEIAGHTDAAGRPDYNQNLSTRRAETVKHYLYTQLGINPARLATRGWGEYKPLTPDNPHHPQNRRVEVINLGGVQ